MKQKKLLTHSLGNPKSSFSCPEALMCIKVRVSELRMFIRDQQRSRDVSRALNVPLSNKSRELTRTVPPFHKVCVVTDVPVWGGFSLPFRSF